MSLWKIANLLAWHILRLRGVAWYLFIYLDLSKLLAYSPYWFPSRRLELIYSRLEQKSILIKKNILSISSTNFKSFHFEGVHLRFLGGPSERETVPVETHTKSTVLSCSTLTSARAWFASCGAKMDGKNGCIWGVPRILSHNGTQEYLSLVLYLYRGICAHAYSRAGLECHDEALIYYIPIIRSTYRDF